MNQLFEDIVSVRLKADLDVKVVALEALLASGDKIELRFGGPTIFVLQA